MAEGRYLNSPYYTLGIRFVSPTGQYFRTDTAVWEDKDATHDAQYTVQMSDPNNVGRYDFTIPTGLNVAAVDYSEIVYLPSYTFFDNAVSGVPLAPNADVAVYVPANARFSLLNTIVAPTNAAAYGTAGDSVPVEAVLEATESTVTILSSTTQVFQPDGVTPATGYTSPVVTGNWQGYGDTTSKVWDSIDTTGWSANTSPYLVRFYVTYVGKNSPTAPDTATLETLLYLS